MCVLYIRVPPIFSRHPNLSPDFFFFSCVVSFHFYFFCYFCFFKFSLISLNIIIIFLSLIFIREILPFVCAFHLVDFWITYPILGIDFKWRNKIQKKKKFLFTGRQLSNFFFFYFVLYGKPDIEKINNRKLLEMNL